MVKISPLVPYNMVLIGHTTQCDIYKALNGEIWHYFGTSKEDFINAKMWKRIIK